MVAVATQIAGGMEMGRSMTLNEFRSEFGGTPRRDYLIDELEKELRAIVGAGHSFIAAVFGSMVKSERKESPGDIDILLCVAQDFGTAPWPLPRGDVSAKGSRRMPQFDPVSGYGPKPPCLSVPALIELFNASTGNVGEDITITIDDCVEVTL